MISLRIVRLCAALAVVTAALATAARAADEPDLIFKRSTVFKLLTPNDKLATYGLDDPEVAGVACYFTVPEKGGLKGLPKARMCFASAARCSSRRCRSCEAATPSAMCWSTWSIPTS